MISLCCGDCGLCLEWRAPYNTRLQATAPSTALRSVKLARTIADLERAPEIKMYHLAEAIQYRPRLSRWRRRLPGQGMRGAELWETILDR